MKPATLTVNVILLTVFSGCISSIRNDCYEAKMWVSNRLEAQSAWRQYASECKVPTPCVNEFRTGFVDGYVDVASGGSGQRPLLPPARYWSAHYANAEGKVRQVAWYNGFSAGALVGLQSGAADRHQLVVTADQCAPCCHTTPEVLMLPPVGTPEEVGQPQPCEATNLPPQETSVWLSRDIEPLQLNPEDFQAPAIESGHDLAE